MDTDEIPGLFRLLKNLIFISVKNTDQRITKELPAQARGRSCSNFIHEMSFFKIRLWCYRIFLFFIRIFDFLEQKI